MQVLPKIVPLSAGKSGLYSSWTCLEDYFKIIKHEIFFRPHGFTSHDAFVIASRNENDGDDCYYAIAVGNEIIGYGMLRGWDYKWDNICLGLSIHPDYRGMGLGKMLLEFLHCVAKIRGVKKLRLKVDHDNEIAKSLYSKAGYEFSGEVQNGELVGYKTL